MTRGFLALLCVYALLLAFGQILFKASAEAARDKGGDFLIALLGDLRFIAAVALYGGITLLWTWILSRVPLSQAYPFVALAFVFTPLLAWIFFGEVLTWSVVLGTGLVLTGLLVLVYAR